MKDFFNSLFWKISAVFLFILLLISIIYMYISVNTADMYFQETRQKLDLKIANHITADNNFFNGDTVNIQALKNVFHNAMIINPSIEVYLLDKNGKILAFDAPSASVKITSVPTEPLKEFISSAKETFSMSVDPKNPDRKKPFSAAEVFDDGKFRGYIYIILGGQEFENASQLLFGSYILRLGVRSMILALLAAAVIGFIAIGFIIRNLKKIVYVIREFQNGDLTARIKLNGKGELREFADSFNEMAQTIVNNIAEMKKMDGLRRNLVANISHDLRTPLSIIRGYVETVLIKDNDITVEERKKYLATILSGTDRLLSLVTELFELSKLEAKESLPEMEPFSLAELLQDIHQKNLIIAQSKNIDLKLELDDKLPLIKGDIRMIERIFQNLLDNAFKFTPSTGTINIEIRKKSENQITASITDTGIGINPEELDNIFDRYYQSKRISPEKNPGTGLGLAIVKKIADLHKIDIDVKSQLSKGTSFMLTFHIRNS